MRAFVTRLFGPRLLLTVVAAVAIGAIAPAHAAVTPYVVLLDGPSEAPPNASAGTGTATVDIDDVAHTMEIHASFAGLTGNTTACHIHTPTAVAGTGTAGVATTTPSFVGFPLGVTAGTFDSILDLTLASSWNPSYVTANGGTPAGAEAAFILSVAAGKAYFNVHSNVFPGGEIRGFLTPAVVPIVPSTWGRVKTLYR